MNKTPFNIYAGKIKFYLDFIKGHYKLDTSLMALALEDLEKDYQARRKDKDGSH